VATARHDSFYLTEKRRSEPKESFKFLGRLALYTVPNAASILDVGCATGEFLEYVATLYPKASLNGLDIRPEFIEKTRSLLPSMAFSVGDIESGKGLPASKFDLVFMSGFNQYFSDFRPWLRNICALTQGAAYVFGVFNPEDLDVYTTVHRCEGGDPVQWNIISHKSISAFLDREQVRHRFIDWSIPIPNPRLHADPMRSWTVSTDEGFLIVSGMQNVQRLAALEIVGDGQ
jgi:SAM-dependent methyltransferase